MRELQVWSKNNEITISMLENPKNSHYNDFMQNEKYMQRALDLAKLGQGSVEPNPMVGAVIVIDDKIVAEGYHKKFGGPHAEREAIADALEKGIDLKGATMYVTLEPCSHQGKTPPCVDALIEHEFAEVFVAMIDPDNKVSGRGIEKLRQAGLVVHTDICRDEARQLLAPYVKLRMRRRPWVICKWAQTTDGYLALPEDEERWISCEQSRSEVHYIRSYCDGILVGINTVEADDPLLNNRSGHGKQPVRIVLDSNLKISEDCNLVKTARDYPTLIATSIKSLTANSDHAKKLRSAGAEILGVTCKQGRLCLTELLDDLGQRDYMNLLVEGGGSVLEAFISHNLADEIIVYTAPFEAGQKAKGLANFDISHAQAMISSSHFCEPIITEIGQDKKTRIVKQVH